VCAEVKKAVFVELKGNKVMTAIEQLSATLDNKTIKTPLKEYTKVAYAVVAKVPSPRVSTRIQTKQNDFKGNKQCTLKVVESSHTYDFVSGKAVK
jgi:hypothetical protein